MVGEREKQWSRVTCSIYYERRPEDGVRRNSQEGDRSEENKKRDWRG